MKITGLSPLVARKYVPIWRNRASVSARILLRSLLPDRVSCSQTIVSFVINLNLAGYLKFCGFAPAGSRIGEKNSCKKERQKIK